MQIDLRVGHALGKGVGVLEWSKLVRGALTIHFPVSIPHIDHSRPIQKIDSIWGIPKVSFWAPSAPGGKHFRKIEPGIWNMALDCEKIKLASQNSVRNPGLGISRSLL